MGKNYVRDPFLSHLLQSKKSKAVIVSVAVVAVAAIACASAYASGVLVPEDVQIVSKSQSVDNEEREGSFSGADDRDASTDSGNRICVHVTGAVASPAVYALSEGARVTDAVAAAGGFAEGANESALNLARTLSDGEQIVVPFLSEAASSSTAESAAATSETSASNGNGIIAGKVNINSATAEELDTLPGVGPSLAQKIIAEREQNGAYKTIDDLTRVSGIGDKKLAQMRDLVCVG